MRRIPVHIVTGASGAQRAALIASLCDYRPDWLGLVTTASAEAPLNVKSVLAACPCCIGKVVMQVSLARALRETGAVRAFVELGDEAHRAGLEGVLSSVPLSLSVYAARLVRLPEHARLSADDFTD